MVSRRVAVQSSSRTWSRTRRHRVLCSRAQPVRAPMDGLSRWIQNLWSDPSPQSAGTTVPGSAHSLERLICGYDDVLIAAGWEPVAIEPG